MAEGISRNTKTGKASALFLRSLVGSLCGSFRHCNGRAPQKKDEAIELLKEEGELKTVERERRGPALQSDFAALVGEFRNF